MIIISEIIVHTSIFLAVIWGIAAVCQFICAGLHACNDSPFVAAICGFVAILNTLLCISYATETETQYIVNITPEASIIEFNNTYEIVEQLDEDTYQVRLREGANASTNK